MTNPILNTDSYKASHFLQYPPGTEYVSAYIEPRGIGDETLIPKDEVVFFGLQIFLKRYLSGVQVNPTIINYSEEIFKEHGLPFNREGWEHINKEHDGKLPVRIQALPEGTVTPTGFPQVQVINTDPKVPWLTTYLETSLLRAIWYPSTVATISREVKKIIYKNLLETADDAEAEIGFKLHDFGARGTTSKEQAGIGGIAHLVNFLGTDTVEALDYGQLFYNEKTAGFSIPAAEHSTITAWGKDQELDAFKNMLDKFLGPNKIVAVVSDSYDIFEACKIWGTELHERVKNSGGTVVIRPDSGDPVEVVCKCLQILEDTVGMKVNSKGYKVLPSYFRLIQGDGVNPVSIKLILDSMKNLGYSASSIAFGMGAGLLQKVNRDTLKYAMKANWIQVNGIQRDIFKNPITDQGKVSKKGRLAVREDGNRLFVSNEKSWTQHRNLLETVFLDGRILKEKDLKTIRERAKL